jgi:hypothetical protein
LERCPDRIGPLRAAGNHEQLGVPDVLLELLADRLLGPGRYGDHETDEVGGDRCLQPTHRVDQQRLATDLSKCLWCLTTEPEPEPGRGNHDRATHTEARLGSENLVEDGLGLVLVGVLGQGQF